MHLLKKWLKYCNRRRLDMFNVWSNEGLKQRAGGSHWLPWLPWWWRACSSPGSTRRRRDTGWLGCSARHTTRTLSPATTANRKCRWSADCSQGQSEVPWWSRMRADGTIMLQLRLEDKPNSPDNPNVYNKRLRTAPTSNPAHLVSCCH